MTRQLSRGQGGMAVPTPPGSAHLAAGGPAAGISVGRMGLGHMHGRERRGSTCGATSVIPS